MLAVDMFRCRHYWRIRQLRQRLVRQASTPSYIICQTASRSTCNWLQSRNCSV